MNIEDIGALMDAGRFRDALAEIEPALKENSNSAQLWFMKGLALGADEDHEGALHCFEQCLELDEEWRDFFSVWYHQGVALSALDRHEKAVSAYERARELAPDDASSAFNLAAELIYLKRIDKALPHARDAERLGHPRAQQLLKVIT